MSDRDAIFWGITIWTCGIALLVLVGAVLSGRDESRPELPRPTGRRIPPQGGSGTAPPRGN